MYHGSLQTLEINDSDIYAIDGNLFFHAILVILEGYILILDLEWVFHFESVDIESLHEQVLLFSWIHTESLRVHSEAFKLIVIANWKDEEDSSMKAIVISVAFREAKSNLHVLGSAGAPREIKPTISNVLSPVFNPLFFHKGSSEQQEWLAHGAER